jgi:ribosomal protein L37AE/L43A
MGKDIDTTTFDPSLVEQPDEPKEADPLGAFPGLPRVRATQVWECRHCHFKPVDEKTGICYNCGRNFAGEFVEVPTANEKPARAQVRSDGD